MVLNNGYLSYMLFINLVKSMCFYFVEYLRNIINVIWGDGYKDIVFWFFFIGIVFKILCVVIIKIWSFY